MTCITRLLKYKVLVNFFILISLFACTTPSQKFSTIAKAKQYEQHIFSGDTFDLVYFTKKSPLKEFLYFYIDGDGTAWITRNYKSIDPTPRNTMMLNLMNNTPGQAIYLGRPCYHIGKNARNCDNRWWTSHRYSELVINEMINAINHLNQEKHQVILIGYSGGGAIAMLMADQVDNLHAIITINANLDIQHWTRMHGYTPLYGSLNPINNLPKKPVRSLHLFGAQDPIIDVKHIQQKLQNHQNTTIKIYPDFTHQCCWEKVWHNIINQNKL